MVFVSNSLVSVSASRPSQGHIRRPRTLLLLCFNGLFPGEPGLAGFIEAKNDQNGGINWSYKLCKAPVKSSSPTNQHPTFLQARCPSYRPANSVKAVKGRENVIVWTSSVCSISRINLKTPQSVLYQYQ